MERTSRATAWLLVVAFSVPAQGWDGHAHKALASAALATAPDELRGLLAPREQSLLEASLGPDSGAMAAAMHGSRRARDLADLLDATREEWRSRRLTPGQLAPRLGVIGHLVADLYAPPDMQAPAGSHRFLENHRVVLADDGPDEDADGAALVARCEEAGSRISATALTLRFDRAFNAVLDAWRYAIDRADLAWPARPGETEIGAPWKELGIRDRGDEQAALEKKGREQRAVRAQEGVRAAEFEEMGAHARFKDAERRLAHAEGAGGGGDPDLPSLVKERDTSRELWQAAVRARESAKAALAKILAGEEEKPPRPELEVVDQSLVRGALGGTLFVRLRHTAGERAAWRSVEASVTSPDGERGRLTLTAGDHPAGEVRLYRATFTSWGDARALSFRFAPRTEAPPKARAGGAATRREAAEALLRASRASENLSPRLPAGAAIPLWGAIDAFSVAGEEDARRDGAAKLRALADAYRAEGQEQHRRAMADPAATRAQRLGERLLAVAAALDRDAEQLVASGDDLGTTFRCRVTGPSGTREWEITATGSEGRAGVTAVSEPWAEVLGRAVGSLSDLAARGAAGGDWEQDADPRPALVRDGLVAYRGVAPSPITPVGAGSAAGPD